METYHVLLFDIDNTLLDFTAGAMQSMEAIFLEAGLAYTPEMFGVFQTENDKLWARIERGELTIAGLRDVRWQTILACLGLEADGAAMEDAFRIRLHESAVPVTGAREVLEHLHGKYRLCAAVRPQTILSKKEIFLTATNAGADCSAPAWVMRFLRQPKIRSSCRRPMHAR